MEYGPVVGGNLFTMHIANATVLYAPSLFTGRYESEAGSAGLPR
jgi:hypothetical protein